MEQNDNKVNIKENIIWGIVFVVFVLILLSIFLNRFTRHNQELIVPDFYALSLEDAETLAASGPFRLEVIDSVYVKRLNKGAIYTQNPKAGSAVKKNRRILLTVNSMQSKKVSMPNLIGLSLRQASAEINAKGLYVGSLRYVEDMATNNVLGQMIGGRSVREGELIETESTIDLLLGLNEDHEATDVPYVKGMTYFEATNAIHYNSLNVGRVIYDSSVISYADSAQAVVYRQTPDVSMAADTASVTSIKAEVGDKVTIYLTVSPEVISEIRK